MIGWVNRNRWNRWNAGNNWMIGNGWNWPWWLISGLIARITWLCAATDHFNIIIWISGWNQSKKKIILQSLLRINKFNFHTQFTWFHNHACLSSRLPHNQLSACLFAWPQFFVDMHIYGDFQLNSLLLLTIDMSIFAINFVILWISSSNE